ncbi:MAG: proline dehydrogenase family protein [Anaerolineales bacterium]|jgi:proline dehydrogenase
MFRSFFIYLSKAVWARRLVTQWSVAWRAASRFVAGETLADAMRVTRELNQKGIVVTLDHLGEHTNTPDEARQACQHVLDILDEIEQAGVRANVSIKLTQIGLGLGYEICKENLATILARAQAGRTFIRLDMEDSPWVDLTLQLYREMSARFGGEALGVVIQSYLYRSEEDVRELASSGVRVRLCKGAYKEPADIAFPKKNDVDASYDHLIEMLIDASLQAGAPELSLSGKIPPIPAVASHDDLRIERAKTYANQKGLPKQALEFQMLFGIRRDLQEHLVEECYPVRVYVPYGTEWYPYFMRRLAERPANLWFFISNYFRR